MARIHTNRKSGFIMRGGGMRRETLWLGGVVQQTTLASASVATLLTSLNAVALAMRPFTIVRTRGIVTVHTDQIAATEDQVVGYGQAVVSDQAAAIGVTAVPTPVADSESDLWFVYQMMFNHFDFASAVGFGEKPLERWDIDSKAMRKVEDGQDFVSVIETAAGGLTAGAIVGSFFRTLIKLH